MKREWRNNRFHYLDGRPTLPAGDAGLWTANGIDTGLSSANLLSRGYADLPDGKTEERGVNIQPPSRYRSLLVPLDGSSFGEHALPLALGIARRAGASVRLVHIHAPLEEAWRTNRLYPSKELDLWLRQQKQVYLDDLVRRLAKVTSVPVEPLLIAGREIASSLCEVSTAADLVVMANHRRGLLGRLWHGCVTGALLRRLPVPLLLIPGHDTPVDLTGDPVPRNVLIPLDGSREAEQVLSPALDLGALTGADHTLLRVLPLEPDHSAVYGRVGYRQTAGEPAHAEAWNYLRRLTGRLKKAARVQPRLLVAEESVAASVLWYAEKNDADLIVLGIRERGRLSRLFRASVADRVARRATTPVLVVRTESV